ncbi:MAG: efflux RND transporter periplasmic adaptor subunit [Planctomycetota bacterium]
MRFPLLLIVVLLGERAEAQTATVQVTPVLMREVGLGRRVVGTVQPIRTSTIGSALDGRVLTLDVDAGEAVIKGQRLVQLRPDTFELQVSVAKAQLELNRQMLAELENGSRKEDIEEAEATMLAAKAASENAVKKLNRLTTLAESRAASDSELEDAREQADATRFTWMAADARLKRIKLGPRVELIAQAQAQLELQTQQVRLLEDQLGKLAIKAPFDGYVAAEFTEIGSWINRGDPVAQVVQLDVVEILVPVTAELVVNLRRGDSIRVEFPELPDDVFVGTIERVVPVADARARTFPVYIRMKNEVVEGVPKLKGGMLARVDVPAGKREPKPLVPKDALVLNGTDRAVYVIDPDPKSNDKDSGIARKVPVRLGVATGEFIQVSGDLDEDDWVVIEGNERLLPGSGVTIVSRALREIESGEPNNSDGDVGTEDQRKGGTEVGGNG